VSGQPVVHITAEALEQLLRFRADAAAPAEHCLYVRVAGAAGEEYRHALSIEPLSAAQAGDLHERAGDLDVVVPAASVERLRGATIDWADEPPQVGFAVHNPNRPSADDALTERVRATLAEKINPSIALHGGHADVAAVEGRTAYLRLSGGCQGCGMAAVTLRQLIESELTEAVPEIADVVDVTDHAAGTNPYYAPV
jgi:Fe/S biogenesis protein NfuA